MEVMECVYLRIITDTKVTKSLCSLGKYLSNFALGQGTCTIACII